MSHNYHVGCRCGDVHDGSYNHAEHELIAAVKQCRALALLRETSWGDDLYDLGWKGYEFKGLAAFLATHYSHGGFYVKGEYRDDKPVTVIPESPPGEYQAICLRHLRCEVTDIEARLLAIKTALGKGAPDGSVPAA